MSEAISQENVKPPIWFWIVGVVMLLWNLLGLFVFAVMVMMVTGSIDVASEQALAGLSEDQQSNRIATKAVIDATPTWVNVAFGVAVVCGVLGSIALLMRRKLAVWLLILSLLGVLTQNAYVYLLSDSIEVMGVGLSPAVIMSAIAIVPFAIFCSRRSWLR